MLDFLFIMFYYLVIMFNLLDNLKKGFNRKSMPELSEFLFVPEVAEKLRCSDAHIRRLIKKGKLSPVYRNGKAFLIPPEALANYLRQINLGSSG